MTFLHRGTQPGTPSVLTSFGLSTATGPIRYGHLSRFGGIVSLGYTLKVLLCIIRQTCAIFSCLKKGILSVA